MGTALCVLVRYSLAHSVPFSLIRGIMNKNSKKELFNSLSECADELLQEIKAYTSSFDKASLLKMKIDEAEMKSAHASYRTLTSKIIRIKNRMDCLTSDISNMLCRADMEMDTEMAAHLIDIFDNYLEWSGAVSSFIQRSDRLFTKNNPDFRLSTAISYATAFLNATEKLKGVLSNEKLYSGA